MSEFIKICSCGEEQHYSRKNSMMNAIRKNIKCVSCSKSGKFHPLYGKNQTVQTRLKQSLAKLGDKNYLFGNTRPLWVRKKISAGSRIYCNESKYVAKRQRSHFQYWLQSGSGKFGEYIGLSLEEFKIWISLKFKQGMSWKNRGNNTWHIDHEIPLSKFDISTEDGVKKAWHYTNLQPLWAKENLSKRAKTVDNL